MPPLTRPNFFTNQFLKAQDLLDEQAYHREMRWRLNRTLYNAPGVAPDGMAVVATPDSNGVTISPGLAIDANGREIVIVDPLQIPLGTNAVPLTVLILGVRYNEVNDPAGSDPATGTVRFTLVPVAEFTSQTNLPQDGMHLSLAKVTLDATGRIAATKGIDLSVRTALGPKLPTNGVSLSSLTSTARTFDNPPIAAGQTARFEIPTQPVGRSVFCLVDVFPTSVGGSISWAWDISEKNDGPNGNPQVHRAVVVTNTSPNSIQTGFHLKVIAISDI